MAGRSAPANPWLLSATEPADSSIVSSISGISSGSWFAILGGVRGQFQTQVFTRAIEEVGLPDDTLAAGFHALDRQSRQLTEAGLASARLDLIGSFVDTLA